MATNTYNFNFSFQSNLSTDLRSFLVSLFDDLTAKIDAAKKAAADEHTQVLAAIQALQGSVTTDTTLNLTAEQKTQLDTMFGDLTDSITHVFDEPAVTPTPTPTPPAPTP